MLRFSASTLVFLLTAEHSAYACPMYDMAKTPQPLSDDILSALARKSNPNHHTVHKSRRNRKLQKNPELIPNTGPDNGGFSYGELTSNAFLNPAGLSRIAYQDPATGEVLTMPDIIAGYSMGLFPGLEDAPGVGQELCIWSMQSLPPPPVVPEAERVARFVDGVPQEFYNYPANDMARAMQLCALGGRRLQQEIVDGNPAVMFAACTWGSQAAAAFCELGIETAESSGSVCDEARVNNTVAWPQAITMFKVTAETVPDFKGFIQNWKDSPDQHRANIVWASAPKDYTEEGNEEFGGVQGSINPGWGSNGGLRAKVIQCDKINVAFLKPAGPNGNFAFGPDEYQDLADTSKTYAQAAFEEWDSLCGIPIGGANSDCIPDADMPASTTEPVEVEETPYALLSYDETCSYSAEYIVSSIACTGSLAETFGDRSTTEALEAEALAGIGACGEHFCESITYAPNQGGYFVDESGFLGCFSEGYRSPEICEEGDLYMQALKNFTQCAFGVSASISSQLRELS
jgi:hypothetical protein